MDPDDELDLEELAQEDALFPWLADSSMADQEEEDWYGEED